MLNIAINDNKVNSWLIYDVQKLEYKSRIKFKRFNKRRLLDKFSRLKLKRIKR